jgi:hypothetical protein
MLLQNSELSFESSFEASFVSVCVQVRIFLLLPVTPMRAVSGTSYPMRARFPTRTRKCRSCNDEHSSPRRGEWTYHERGKASAKL